MDTQFRLRYRNRKSLLLRLGKGQSGICSQSLYAHFFEQGHGGLHNLTKPTVDIL